MLLRPPAFRHSCRISSSSMAHVIHLKTSINNNGKQVEMSKNNHTSNDKQGDVGSAKPVRKRLAFGGLNAIRKHLGYETDKQQPNASTTARNNTICSLFSTNNQSSAMDVSKQTTISASKALIPCSKQPERPSLVDADQKNSHPWPSEKSGCSGSMKGDVCLFAVDCHVLEECSLPNTKAEISASEVPVSSLKQPEHPAVVDADQEDKCSLPSVSSGCSGSGEKSVKDNDFPIDIGCTLMLDEYSLPNRFGKHEPANSRKPKFIKHSVKDNGSNRNKYPKKRTCAPIEVFDMCQSEADDYRFLRSSLDFVDEAKVPEVGKLSDEPRQIVLRPGMILLKSYISNSDQVSIVRKCRKLGIGPGGFYRPGYKYGGKLRLHMMCLGLDWDPQTRKYQKRRRIDRSEPPGIPPEFLGLVDRAMLDSLALIRSDSKVSSAEDILPQINPDICIVNFYSETGRLGLHQDRDESIESLKKGLPVVSFSIGDSAEFLYGDQRDANKAENLILDSGDVLIFGGESRHVFHGVASIIPNSAPRFLLEETRLLPGRLNLTFRQY